MNMMILRNTEVIEMLARVSGKWIVEVFGLDIDWHELEGKVLTQENCQAAINKILAAAPFLLNSEERDQIMCEGTCVILFKAENEARQLYESLPSDDNPPSEENGIRFYMKLYSPVDGFVTEST